MRHPQIPSSGIPNLEKERGVYTVEMNRKIR